MSAASTDPVVSEQSQTPTGVEAKRQSEQTPKGETEPMSKRWKVDITLSKSHWGMATSYSTAAMVACGTTHEYREEVRRLTQVEDVVDAEGNKKLRIGLEIGSAHGMTTQILSRRGDIDLTVGFDMDQKLVDHCRDKYTGKKDIGNLYFDQCKIEVKKLPKQNFVLAESCEEQLRKWIQQRIDDQKKAFFGKVVEEKTEESISEAKVSESKAEEKTDIKQDEDVTKKRKTPVFDYTINVLAIDIAGTVSVDMLFPILEALRMQLKPKVTVVKSIVLKQLITALSKGESLRATS